MLDKLRAYPMVVLLLPLVAAILLFITPPERYAARSAPNRLQQRCYERLCASGLSGDELATVGALTLGYKEELGKELRQRFQASGAAHVLAVSGLHTCILYAVLVGVLTLGGRVRPMHDNRLGRWALCLLLCAALWGYAWLTGMTPSVVRAVLMLTLYEIGRALYRDSFSLNTIAAAAVLILLVHPQDLWSVSFQLSFTATAAIVCLTPLLPLREERRPRIGTYILGIVVVSVAAQLGTLPVTMYYFGQVSTYFLLTNLIVLPIASLLVPCGLMSIALGGCWFGPVFSKITFALAWAMNHSVGWIESLPGSTLSAQVNGAMVAIYYVCLLAIWAFIPKKRA